MEAKKKGHDGGKQKRKSKSPPKKPGGGTSDKVQPKPPAQQIATAEQPTSSASAAVATQPPQSEHIFIIPKKKKPLQNPHAQREGEVPLRDFPITSRPAFATSDHRGAKAKQAHDAAAGRQSQRSGGSRTTATRTRDTRSSSARGGNSSGSRGRGGNSSTRGRGGNSGARGGTAQYANQFNWDLSRHGSTSSQSIFEAEQERFKQNIGSMVQELSRRTATDPLGLKPPGFDFLSVQTPYGRLKTDKNKLATTATGPKTPPKTSGGTSGAAQQPPPHKKSTKELEHEKTHTRTESRHKHREESDSERSSHSRSHTPRPRREHSSRDRHHESRRQDSPRRSEHRHQYRSKRHDSPHSQASSRRSTTSSKASSRRSSTSQQVETTAASSTAQQKALEQLGEQLSASAGFGGQQQDFGAWTGYSTQKPTFTQSAGGESSSTQKATSSRQQPPKRPGSAGSSGTPFKVPKIFTTRKTPLSEEFNKFERTPITIENGVSYVIIHAGPRFAVGLRKRPDAKGIAPTFVHINTAAEAPLRIGYFATIRKFHRKVNNQGILAPIQDIMASETDLCQDRRGKTLLIPSFITNDYIPSVTKSDNIIHGAPAMIVNVPAPLEAARNDDRYILRFELVSGFFVGSRIASNITIDEIFSMQNGNIPKQYDVVKLDLFRVPAGQFYRLGQCVVPPGIFHPDALYPYPAAAILEHVTPLDDNHRNLLARMGDLTRNPFPAIENFTSQFKFIRAALGMQAAAAIYIEMEQCKHSEMLMVIRDVKKDHRTILDKFPETKKVDKQVARARANQFKMGANVIIKKPSVQKPNHPYIFAPKEEKPFYHGILEHPVHRDGRVFGMVLYRTLYKPVITGELALRETRQQEASEIARFLDHSDLEPNSYEAKKAMKEALAHRELAEVTLADGQDQPNQDNVPRDENAPETESQRQNRKTKEREDAPGATDQLFFDNLGITVPDETRYAVLTDEKANSTRNVLRAYQSWEQNLSGMTHTSKLCCLLHGIKPRYEESVYDKHTEYRKLIKADIQREAAAFIKKTRIDGETEPDFEEDDEALGLRRKEPRGRYGGKLKQIEANLEERSKRRKLMIKAVDRQSSLDEEQKKAVINLLKHTVSKCQAPGGTGKSYLAAHACIFALQCFDGEKVVLLAEANMAVAHMVKQLNNILHNFSMTPITEHSVFLVRSSAAEIRQQLSDGFDEYRLESHLKVLSELPTVDDENGWTIERANAVRKYLQFADNDEYVGANLGMMNQYVVRYQPYLKVIALTKNSAFALRYFIEASTFIVDEAGQMLADDLIVLLTDSCAERLMCVGDLFQQGCYIPFGLEDKGAALRQDSIMELLQGRMQTCSKIHRAEVTLTRCFRFQETIRELVSFACYEEYSLALEDPYGAASKKEAVAISGYPFPKRYCPVLLIHTEEAAAEPETGSCHNIHQRQLAGRIHATMQPYLDKKKLNSRFLFNSFYLDEANLIKDAIEKNNLQNAESYSVHSFQGQEREVQVIVTSKVKSKEKAGKIPFVLNPRLMTTALTRGAEAIAIVGNFNWLCDLRFGPMARFVFAAVKKGIPIVDARYFEFIEANQNLFLLDPHKNVPYDANGDLIVNTGKGIKADTWANDIQSHRLRETPRSTYKWLREDAPRMSLTPSEPSAEYIARAQRNNAENLRQQQEAAIRVAALDIASSSTQDDTLVVDASGTSRRTVVNPEEQMEQ